VGAALHLTGVLGGLEQSTVNVRFRARHRPPPQGIVVVAIDSRTFSELGVRWPFPRSLHARALERLRAAEPREIVYDVQFTEPARPPEDRALYRAVGATPGILLATTEVDGHGHTNVLGGDASLARVHARAVATNLSNGSQGLIARFPYAVGGLESVGVAASEQVTGKALSPARFGHAGALIDFQGPEGAFPTVSFSRLLSGRVRPEVFRGKIVVVGATAPTLGDVHPTPSTGTHLMAGPEVQANAIWTAQHGLPLSDASDAANLLLVVLLAAIAPVARSRLRVQLVALMVGLAAILYAVGAQLLFNLGTIVDFSSPMASLIVAGIGTVMVSELAEGHERQRVALDNELLELRVRERTEELYETQLEVVRRLGQAVEYRDHAIGVHIENIRLMCERLGAATGMTPEEAELLGQASTMHDVGKIGIPDEVLLKPGRLDAREWRMMKEHTAIGAGILGDSKSPLMRLAETIAQSHHERWDGSGYPQGLSGEEIPLPARICAICDVLDALITARPYKEAWTWERALAEIQSERERHFDPHLVDLFVELAPELRGGLRRVQ